MRGIILSTLALGALMVAVPTANAAKRGTVIEKSHHDRGLHRGWSHSRHWGARAHRTRVIIRH